MILVGDIPNGRGGDDFMRVVMMFMLAVVVVTDECQFMECLVQSKSQSLHLLITY
jgi:hypothetical protein